MSYGRHPGLVSLVVAAAMSSMGPAFGGAELTSSTARKDEPRVKRAQRETRQVYYTPPRSLLPPSKKRRRVSTRKPPKRGKTAAALRRYGYSRA